MKVVSGKAHGCKLKSPNGLDVRPTIARIKEAIFNSLMPRIDGSIFLDLFSGSGAMGIEALSRGSSKVFFVEKNKACMQIIKTNLSLTKLSDNADLVLGDAIDALNCFSRQKLLFDIIFMDPPYYKNFTQQILLFLAEHDILAEDGLIVCETGSKEILPDILQFDFFKSKYYNTTAVHFVRKK